MTDESRPARVKILIVDDHPVMRRGLAHLIDAEPDLTVCGEAVSTHGALEAVRESRPDLVIVDLELKDSHGVDLVKELKIRYPALPALVISMHDEELYGERALRAGARGYVNKQELDETMLVAIRCVLAGTLYMSDALTSRLAVKFIERSRRETDPDSPMGVLSDRELQVFRLIGQGRTTREMASTLYVSTKTIESHRQNIKEKLHIKSMPELVQRATKWLVTVPQD